MLGEGKQGFVGNRVDRVGRRERLNVERVARRRVFGAGAGPQQPLRPGAGGGELAPALGREQIAIGVVGPHRDGDAQAVVERRRNRLLHRHVPAADEQRSDGVDPRVEPGFDSALDPAQIRLGRGDVMFARKQQGDVDWHTVEDRLLDSRNALSCAGDLDEEVGTRGARMQLRGHLDGVDAVVGEQRRDFERDPAVDTAARVVNRPEQVGGLRQVCQREFEEDALVRQAARAEALDRVVVEPAAANRIVEDRRVRGQPGHRQLGNVARQGAVRQHFAGDVVEPEALPQIVQLAGVGVHHFSFATGVAGQLQIATSSSNTESCGVVMRRPSRQVNRTMRRVPPSTLQAASRNQQPRRRRGRR